MNFDITPGPEQSADPADPDGIIGVPDDVAAEAAAGRTRASVAARGAGPRGTVRGSLFQGNLDLMLTAESVSRMIFEFPHLFFAFPHVFGGLSSVQGKDGKGRKGPRPSGMVKQGVNKAAGKLLETWAKISRGYGEELWFGVLGSGG